MLPSPITTFPSVALSVWHTVTYEGQATVRDLKRMRWSQLIQVKRRKRIKDKCQTKKNEEADWCTAREGRDITGGTGTKTTCQRERATRRADVQMRGGWSTGCTCKLIKQCSI